MIELAADGDIARVIVLLPGTVFVGMFRLMLCEPVCCSMPTIWLVARRSPRGRIGTFSSIASDSSLVSARTRIVACPIFGAFIFQSIRFSPLAGIITVCVDDAISKPSPANSTFVCFSVER